MKYIILLIGFTAMWAVADFISYRPSDFGYWREIWIFAVAAIAYWLSGIYVMCKTWLDDFETVTADIFLMIVTIFWLIWPFYAIGFLWKITIGRRLNSIVIIRRRRP